MEHWINLAWPVDYWQLEKIFDFYEIQGDAIIYYFHIDGLDLTNCAIRGEIYDLNVSNRMANDLGGAMSAPEIVVTDAVNGKFTATCHTGLTSTMQPYAQVEFNITDNGGNGNKWTIMQQPIHFENERIVWTNENMAVTEGDEGTGEDPLF